MNLIDELSHMQAKGKSVISVTYILNRLELPQTDYCEFCEQLPNSKCRTWRKAIQLFRKGGD